MLMKILLIYPHYPDSFWSFKHALKFVSKKAAVPPLGLITISAMLPETWEKKLVDMNVSKLNSTDIAWADYIFISAMYIQKISVNKIITECKTQKKTIVAGGPLFTQEHKNYPEIDHFILNEAEITLPKFLSDLSLGKAQRVYTTNDYADITTTPIPDFHLLERNKYVFMNIQVTRGCPFACSFCEITSLLGHKVRKKSSEQVLNELETLYQLNWRGSVFIVDDNFIGNKLWVKNQLLPKMLSWMQAHKFPFTFNTETSINLADDDELMRLMVDTGFSSTFIGIETPVEESLHNCNKTQNRNRNLVESVKKILKSGIQVSGGFIVGFDTDTASVFQRQIDFIQKSGIVSAMVGLLNAPKNTNLYKQMQRENRLTVEPTGNNTDMSMNFIPKMNVNDLLGGYEKIIQNIYNTKAYYKRLRQMLLSYKIQYNNRPKIRINTLIGFFKSMLIIGILNKGRFEYWKLLIWTIFKKPKAIPEAITFAVYGYHFRKVYRIV